MKRYEGALRRLSILFILLNLLSPLSTSMSLAQDSTPPAPEPNLYALDTDGDGMSDGAELDAGRDPYVDEDAAQVEAERLAAEQAEAERLAQEEAERIAAEQAEAERIAAEEQAAADAAATQSAIDAANAEATQAAIDAANAEATQATIDAANAEATQSAVEEANARATEEANAEATRIAEERAEAARATQESPDSDVVIMGGVRKVVEFPSYEVTKPYCLDGQVTSASVKYTSNGKGISQKSISPSGPQDGSGTTTFVLEINKQGNHAWPRDMQDWEKNNTNNTKATKTITVDGAECDAPELSITKTAAPATVAPGGTVAFTITVSSDSHWPENVRIADPLPAGFTDWSEGSYGCWINSNGLECELKDLWKGETFSVTVTGTADGSVCGPITNTATVTWDGRVGYDSTASDSATTHIECPTPIFPTITFTQAACNADGSFTEPSFSLDTSTVTGLTIDTMKSGGADSDFNNVEMGATYTVIASLAPNYVFPDPIPEGWSLVQGSHGPQVSRAVTLDEVDCSPDVRVTKSPNPASISEGADLSFVIEVENLGPGKATNVTLTDILPTLPDNPVRPAGTAWTVAGDSGCAAITGNELNCDFGDLAPGASKNVAVSFPTAVGDIGEYPNTAHVAAENEPEGKQGNNSSSATVVVTGLPESDKITFCHWNEGQGKNSPYVKVTTSKNGLVNGHINHHHGNDIWPSFTHGGTTYTAQGEQRLILDDCKVQSKVTIAKSGTTSVHPGEFITYTITVKNDGNVTITGIKVMDQLPTGIAWSHGGEAISNGAFETTIEMLKPGKSTSYTITGTVPGDGSVCGPLSNTATYSYAANGNIYGAGSGDSSPAVTTTINCDPSLTIVKTAVDASGKPVADDDRFDLGETVNFTITVTNTGNIPLTNVTLVDEDVVNLTCDPAALVDMLPVDGTIECAATHVITERDILAGSFTNTATATSEETGPEADSATVLTVKVEESLSLTKNANPASVETASTTVIYTFVVKNTGNQTLDNVTITDTFTTDVTNDLVWETAYPDGMVGTLAPGQEVMVTASLVVMQDEIDAGDNIVNTAIATSGEVTSRKSEATVEIVQDQAVEASKTAVTNFGENGRADAGDSITYTIEVKNTGNVTLENVALNDVLTVNDVELQDALEWEDEGFDGVVVRINVGEPVTITATYFITQSDIDDGVTITNCIDVEHDTTDGDDCPSTVITPAPAMSVVKDATNIPDPIEVDSVITYTFTVHNDGNTTLEDVKVADHLSAPAEGTVSWPDGDTIETIPVGESRSITATYTVTQPDIDHGSIHNCATASDGTTSSPAEDEDACATVTIDQAPSISLEKSASPRVDVVLDAEVAYTLTATNDGNVSLNEVLIEDDMLDGLVCKIGDVEVENGSAELAPSESMTCVGTYTVTQLDIDTNGGEIVNNADASGTSPQGDPVEDKATETVQTRQQASILLDKQVVEVDGQAVTPPVIGLDAEDEVTYRLIATNSGDVTLTDVVIEDLMLETLECDLDAPVELVPGESLECTGSYIVTQGDVNDGDPIVNTATTEGTTPWKSTVDDDDSVTITPVSQQATLALDKKATAVNGEAVPGDGGAYPVTGLEAGDVVTYTLIARNAGNVTLSNVEISDGMLGTLECDPAQPASLERGGSLECTGTYEVTQGDIDRQLDIVNSAEVTATDPHGNPVEPAEDTETVRVATASTSLTLVKTASTPQGEEVLEGTEITYTFDVTNTGNVTLYGVVVDDPLPNLEWDDANPGGHVGIIEPGEENAVTLTASYVVTWQDVEEGEVTNLAIAGGMPYECLPRIMTTSGGEPDPCNVRSNEDGTTTPVVQEPALVIAKTATTPDGEAIVEGTVITYQFTVTNTGNVKLDDVSVDDLLPNVMWDDANPDGSIGTLARSGAEGDSKTITATYIVTAEDVENGEVFNEAFATGFPPNCEGSECEVDSPPDDETVTVDQTLSFDLAKTCPDSAAGARVGDTITYEVTVTNNGTVRLSNVVVEDVREGVFLGESWPTTFAPGQSETRMFQTTIQPEDAANWNLDNTIVVTANRGSQQLERIPSILTTVVEVDENNNVRAEFTAECAFTPVTGLEIEKSATPDEVSALGDEITYMFLVSNTGDVSIEDIVVVDDMLADAGVSIPSVGTLAAGASTTVEATYVVTQDDLDRGSIYNSAIASGELPDCEEDCDVDSPPDDTDTPVDQSPSLAIEKTAATPEGETVGRDTVITYTFVVTNTGNVTLHNVVVDDPLPGLTWAEGSENGEIGELAPGEEHAVTLTATYVVTQNDVDQGNVHNSAIAVGDGPNCAAPPILTFVQVNDEADDCGIESPPSETDTPISREPAIELVKTAILVNGADMPYPVEHLMLGEEITYEMVATNTGNVTLTNVEITDPMEGLSALDCDAAMPATLALGEDLTCLATYTITQEDLDGRNVDNTATVTGVAPDETEVIDSDTERVVGHFEPILEIEKSAATPDGEAVIEGTVITYSFVVSNTGNISIHEIVVNDPLPGLTWAEGSENGAVGSLAPGGEATLTATYVVTAEDVVAGNVHNTAIATGDLPFCLNDVCDTQSPPSETDTPVTQGPAIDLVKTATVVNGEEVPYPVEHLMLGDLVTYELVATNIGNVPLTDVTIDDPMEGLSALECDLEMPAILASGEALTCLATYTITQENLDGRNVDNTATVTATAPDGSTVSDVDTERVVGHFEPILEIEKSASPEKDVEEGDTITYTFVVTSTGNITVHDIAVVDEMPGLVWNEANADGYVGTLAPGEEATVTATYVVTTEDVKAGKVHNSAIASGHLTTCLQPDECEVISEAEEVTVSVVQPTPPAMITPKPKPIAGLPNTGSGTSTDSGDLGWSVALMAAGALAATAVGIRRRESV